jgi:hypothetical protein
MKIVDLGRIDVGERSGEDVRLFSVVALQTDAVAGRNTASSKFGRSTTSIVLPEAYLRPSARRSARVVFCAFQLFIPDLYYSSGFLPRNWRKPIGRAHRTETEIATSTLLRIAFEYGQIA